MLYLSSDIMKKIKLIIIICLILSLIPLGINFFVIFQTVDKIYNEKEINSEYDIALVLGCSALKDGTPSKMLRDRLNTAIYLYENKLVKKILISGDHTKTYSEITAMNKYLIEYGINENDILIDEKGYSTNESIINYQREYESKSVILVTQQYHLYRALFIADKLGINAIGAHAKLINYNGQVFREIREILARNKDFFLFTFIK